MEPVGRIVAPPVSARAGLLVLAAVVVVAGGGYLLWWAWDAAAFPTDARVAEALATQPLGARPLEVRVGGWVLVRGPTFHAQAVVTMRVPPGAIAAPVQLAARPVTLMAWLRERIRLLAGGEEWRKEWFVTPT